MLTKVSAAGLSGTEGYLVCVEADVGDGLPGINLIGYLASAVREASDRVRTAIRNSGFCTEPRRVTVNLSPADVRKDGCGYDFAIALGLLGSYGILSGERAKELLRDSVFLGELSLGGDLLEVHGVLSLVSAARDAGYKNVFVPLGNAMEAAAISGIRAYPIQNLRQMIDILNAEVPLPEAAEYQEKPWDYVDEKDFSDVCGQELIKRATIIAVCGRHNILYIGPAGTGKSMIASRIPGILPEMSREEQLEISKIYSICGLSSSQQPLLPCRPFRSPHHTISEQALTGGGTIPKPGEISLASGGVLFLDEMLEFKPSVLENLRQPLETRSVMISRMHSSVTFPADFVLCAATNPCKCGFYPDRSRCRCTETQIKSYLSRISRPILDRIDICVETAVPHFTELNGIGRGQKSYEIREDVERVRRIQEDRLKEYGMRFNSEMTPPVLDRFCRLSEDDTAFLRTYYEKKNVSARGLNKILKVARTISDYEGLTNIGHEQLCEAISYRNLEEKYWGGGGTHDEAFRWYKKG